MFYLTVQWSRLTFLQDENCKKEVCMIRKYHNHTLQTNPRHCEEESQILFLPCILGTLKTPRHTYPKISTTVKPALGGHSKIDKAKIFMTKGSLMQVKSIAECSPWSILQYFWPALSDKCSWKPFCDLFESGRFRQVLLYSILLLMRCVKGSDRFANRTCLD